VTLRYAQAFGGTTEGAGQAPSQSQTASNVDLDDILTGGAAAVAAPAVAETPAVEPDSSPVETVGTQDTTPEVSTAPEAEASVPEPAAEEKKSGDVLDFDSLLSGL